MIHGVMPLPGAVVRAVVLEPEIKGNRDTDHADRLPRHGEMVIEIVDRHVYRQRIGQTYEKGLLGPVEGHEEAVVPFHIHLARSSLMC